MEIIKLFEKTSNKLNKKRILVFSDFYIFHKHEQKLLIEAKDKSLLEKKDLIVVMFAEENNKIFEENDRLKFLEKISPNYIIVLPQHFSLSQQSITKLLNYFKDDLNIKDIFYSSYFYINDRAQAKTIDLKIMFDENFNSKSFELKESVNNLMPNRDLLNTMIDVSEFQEIKTILGFNYFLRGEVIHGVKLGKRLGAPTANMFIDKHMKTPQHGVYFTITTLHTLLKPKKYFSISIFSTKPTLKNQPETLETHLLNYRGVDFYNEIIEIEFIQKHRNIETFNSIKELKKAIKNDIKKAKDFFNKNY